ncbi:hypothetical protein [Flammeovirga kamogawensis]|uniref:Glycine zipper family protein n=1 Tax=Flammeovirga kamogawensis TaxID=373891 RepID=A0ABX8GQH6_9BACT|nr:hypothetical protein [Flammeovirga kamogawensis]MBB6463032.1 hypothetical protein [Flammeovirga kamogawensis]QWG05669.1 hypothetical protein KM029_09765 [Flammeovirga kamogawensis]TRX67499.1 hypothetical protein EO216_04800 [Flammeovirga kamogawensis]
MNITKIQKRATAEENKKLLSLYSKIENLLTAIGQKELPESEISSINEQVDSINSFDGNDKALIKLLKRTYSTLISHFETKFSYTGKNYYRNRWLAIGMMGGVIIGTLTNAINIGIGLSIGLCLGIAYGTHLDKKAAENGNQLAIEISEY